MVRDLPKLNELDKKLIDNFPHKVVRKSYVADIPELRRIPVYVTEFLINIHAESDGTIQKDAIEQIIASMQKYSPEKKEKEAFKSMAMELGQIDLIDHFSVYTDLARGFYYTQIQFLDTKAKVNRDLISPNQHQSLLKGGLWGKATFEHMKQGDSFSLNMNKFESYQTAGVILKKYIKNRRSFSSEEWLDFIMRNIGFNPDKFTRYQKLLYLARLIPMVEPCTNLLELGPPGTGKSFIYENTSEYNRMLLGGEITPAKLIYNQGLRQIGLVFTKDVVCFDEINKKNPKIKDLIPKLQQIMASDKVERGELEARTEVSLVFQGNIDFTSSKDHNFTPKDTDFLKILPKGMNDAAFLDRIHMFLHGWSFGRILDEHLNKNLGLISNYFGQILHKLRRQEVSSVINENFDFYQIDNKGNERGISVRDKNALYHIISGYIKLLYPDKIATSDELKEIADLAMELRQNVISEIVKIDSIHNRSLKYRFEPDEEIDDINRNNIIQQEEQQNLIDESDLMKKTNEITKTEEVENINFDIDLSTIKINKKGAILHKIPYWILKSLVDCGDIVENDNIFYIKEKEIETYYHQFIEGIPILIQNLGEINIDYNEEEESIKDIIKLLKKLEKIVKEYTKNRIELSIIENKLYQYKDSSDDIKNIIDEYNGIVYEKEPIPLKEISSISENIEIELDLISTANGQNPDLLSKNYKSIIEDKASICIYLEKKIENWKAITVELRENLKKILKMVNPITEKIESEIKNENLLFKGKKFTFYALDVNNIYNSFKNKFKTNFSKKEHPLSRFKRRYLKEENYLACYFASKHLEKLSKQIIPEDQNNKWFIEDKIKDNNTGQYVDVDATLTGETARIIELYRDQIETFYLGSGDKDLHYVVELAHKYKINVKIIVTESSNLSYDLQVLVDFQDISLYN